VIDSPTDGTTMLTTIGPSRTARAARGKHMRPTGGE
jgi:hypothetical protein